jgi:hypothetical protein
VNFRKAFKPRLPELLNACLNYDISNPIKDQSLKLALALEREVEAVITEEKVGCISTVAKYFYQWNQSILKIYLLTANHNSEKKESKE